MVLYNVLCVVWGLGRVCVDAVVKECKRRLVWLSSDPIPPPSVTCTECSNVTRPLIRFSRWMVLEHLTRRHGSWRVVM